MRRFGSGLRSVPQFTQAWHFNGSIAQYGHRTNQRSRRNQTGSIRRSIIGSALTHTGGRAEGGPGRVSQFPCGSSVPLINTSPHLELVTLAPRPLGQILFPSTPFTSSGWLLSRIRFGLDAILSLISMREQLLTDSSKLAGPGH